MTIIQLVPHFSVSPTSQLFRKQNHTVPHHHLVPSDQYARDFGMRGTGSHKDQYSLCRCFKGRARMVLRTREPWTHSQCGKPGSERAWVTWVLPSQCTAPVRMSPRKYCRLPDICNHEPPLPWPASAMWAQKEAPSGARQGRLEDTSRCGLMHQPHVISLVAKM